MERLSRRTLTAFLFLALAFVYFAANAGKLLVVDAPEKSDVIVVLAGETDGRPARGIELLRQGFARHLLIDVPAAARIYNQTQIQIAEQYVAGLPEAAMIDICPITGLSTKDESRDVERCLGHVDGQRILLVTSDFHTRRALMIFHREIRGGIFTVASSYDDREFGTRWWSRRQWAKTCLDEWLKLIWWNVVDRWR